LGGFVVVCRWRIGLGFTGVWGKCGALGLSKYLGVVHFGDLSYIGGIEEKVFVQTLAWTKKIIKK